MREYKMKEETYDKFCKLQVKCEDNEKSAESHPHCAHGPTVLFYYKNEGPQKGYFACSAYRDRKNCSIHIPFKNVNTKHLTKNYAQCILQFKRLREKFLDKSCTKPIHYCLSCNKPADNVGLEHHGHNIERNVSRHILNNPTLFLPPMDNDKGQAQYFFDEKSLNFFTNTFKDLEINKVICIGAPRLHGHLINNCPKSIKSFLLDFDHRFFYFYNDDQFAWFNMCNNYFFDSTQKHEFISFLKCKSNERLLLFTDPPFACRTELIGNTIQKITEAFNEINKLPHQPLPVFWIFPYYSAHYVQQVMPSLNMSDYKINYTNHKSYSDVGSKCRKLGSPVRLFTNVPLELIKLPICEKYKYCSKCEKYTSLENQHCIICKCCPSKNGSTYRHCTKCGLCVKPYYIHCHNCRRCCQSEGHNCLEYQSKQKCWICRTVGHTELHCKLWQKKSGFSIFSSAKGIGTEEDIKCLLCNCKGHNELNCEKRSNYIQEVTFMGESCIC